MTPRPVGLVRATRAFDLATWLYAEANRRETPFEDRGADRLRQRADRLIRIGFDLGCKN